MLGNSNAYILAVVSQKGGVGKSTLARLVAREFAKSGYAVKIADLDVSQATCVHWQNRRLEAALNPVVAVEAFGNVRVALKEADRYELLILDGAPHATKATRDIAHAAHLVVIPTGLAVDDLLPAVSLAHDLQNDGIPTPQMVFALCRVGTSPAEIAEARRYIQDAGYRTLAGDLPERTAYRRASDEGRALTETRFPTLNHRAENMAQAIVDALAELTEE